MSVDLYKTVSLVLPKLVFILIVSMASPCFGNDEPTGESALPNHFIVLMDGSGSMKDSYYSWWGIVPGKNKEINRRNWQNLGVDKISKKVKELLNKALTGIPSTSNVPQFTPNDTLSFLFFHVFYKDPSFAIDDIFVTTPELKFDANFTKNFWDESWVDRINDDIANKKHPFKGHSPIIAATPAVIPYLGKAEDLPDKNKIFGRVIIIRITDGTYNSEANGADEYNIIRKNLTVNNQGEGGRSANLGKPEKYEDYKPEIKKVNQLFDIGGNSEFCVYSLTGDPHLLCENDKKYYDRLGELTTGDGWLFSYLEATPKIPNLKLLANPDKNTIEFRREVRKDEQGNAEVVWVGDNRMVARAYKKFLKDENGQDSKIGIEAKPTALHFEYYGGARIGWAKLEPCPTSGDDRACGELVIHRGEKLLDELPTKDRDAKITEGKYPVTYQIKFLADPRNYPVYPFSIEKSDNIDVEARFIDEKFYDGLRGFIGSTPLHITDEKLLAEAKKSSSGNMTAQALFEESDKDLDKNWVYRTGYSLILVALIIMYWFFFPKRRWQVSMDLLEDFKKNPLVEVDLNRQSTSTILLGEAKLSEIPPKHRQYRRGGWLPHQINILFNIPLADSNINKVGLEWKSPDSGIYPFGIADYRENEYLDKKAVDGSKYPIYFNASQLNDFLPNNLDYSVRDIPIKFAATSKRPDGGDQHTMEFTLRVLPEKAKFHWQADPCDESIVKAKDDNKYKLQMDYGDGGILELMRYRLTNQATHQFCEPAQGYLQIKAELGDIRLANGAFYLTVDDPQERLDKYSYCLSSKQPQKDIVLFVDLDILKNPADEPMTYKVEVEIINDLIDADGENRPLVNLGRVEFILERSKNRSLLELELEEPTPRIVYESEARVDVAALVPVEIHDDEKDLADSHIFQLKLCNRCLQGYGHVVWQTAVSDTAAVGISINPGAVSFGRAGARQGQIEDNREETKRTVELGVTIDKSRLRFTQQDAQLSLVLKLRCEKFLRTGDAPWETIEWMLTANFTLKHFPLRQILAIDFGTSAITIAHAKDKNPEFLRFDHAKIDPTRRLSQGLEPSEYFLCADTNLHQAFGTVHEKPTNPMRPDDKNYLDLPAYSPEYAQDHADAIIPSLKMLLVKGQGSLPINAQKYPYLNEDEKPVKEPQPPLEAVMHGVMKKLRDDYIKPLLSLEEKKFYYLVMTHPNTYTAVERKWLRDIVIEEFKGGSDVHSLYPGNIHLLGEADAVLDYYLLKHSKINQNEVILIWDIGAGTLDMTLAKVSWSNGKRKVKILNRYGVEAAGNLLTECIARDLHRVLAKHAGESYTMPIEVDEKANQKKTKESLRVRLTNMKALRNNIELFKRNMPKNVISTDNKIHEKLEIPIEGKDYLTNSGNKDGGLITNAGNIPLVEGLVKVDTYVCWQPSISQLCEGEYVKAFTERVASNEVKRFIAEINPSEKITTVITSGRTSLWPGLRERLEQTLPDVKNWQDFAKDPQALKQAVAGGAVISQIQDWTTDHELDAPAVFGDYHVRFELDREGDWRTTKLPTRPVVEAVEVFMPIADDCQVGIFHNKQFHTLFTFRKKFYSAGGSTLIFKMIPDEQGNFQCIIENEKGKRFSITEEKARTTRGSEPDYEVWPWSQPHRLKPLDSANIAEPEDFV